MPGPAFPHIVGDDGWVASLQRVPSPNFDARPPGTAITLVVLHNISLPPGRYGGGHVQRLFTNQLDTIEHPFLERLRDVHVSAHFLIERDGRCTQFVSCRDRAWHAGTSEYAGRARCNDFSIGIELEGSDFDAFEAAQYTALNALLEALAAAYPLEAIVGHSEIAPGRKTDPGPGFDWKLVALPSRLLRR